ncbi:hypothetical protein SAMN04487968_111139 [Nocardioides terrae]|uniref:DUF4149 domain-containing protein n=1 Tax=Nocardioides terrae TaxID=574651 RepID=A0A1I1M471_9ACTN|nr:hypothetical protein [Nocardioides terrae]SFC79846.1 hypothetical protein SAMN04487968_111139 [Nocardioides terrae]
MTELAAAVTWLWLGMVLAISFLEAPLKFQVVDIPTGLGIGRVVFRALNSVEAVLAVVLVVALVSGDPGRTAGIAGAAAVLVLAVQLVGVRPSLTRRSDAVLAAGSAEDAPRSHAHLWYVGLELVKVAALVVAGVALL